jgi:glycosyltransferase involved in cell wall biosynthesis
MKSEVANRNSSYVLLTAAYNEEDVIKRTIESVLRQTVLPKRWVVVSDNSTDQTDDIVREYAMQHDFVELVHITRSSGHNFGAKVLALREGYKRLLGFEYGFIGNLDADIELESTYFETILHRMTRDPTLGIAGGFVYEKVDGRFKSRRNNQVYSVAHAAQLVRRECYEAIGGYAVLQYGGEDTHAATSARMLGWEAISFSDLRIYHLHHVGNDGSRLRSAFRQGRMEYHLGYDILYEFMKCIYRMRIPPFIIGGISRILGFISPYFGRHTRAVNEEFVAFMRKEQRDRMFARFGGHGDNSVR